MTRVLLTRHGETDQNKNGVLQGQIDTSLNDTGIQQARRLAERLADEEITAVYSSGLQRARKTAELVAEPHDIQPKPLDELNERSYGELEGEPKEKRQEVIQAAGTPWHNWQPDGGEHLSDVARRCIPALDTIREQHADETVVIVAHGNVNKSILATLIGADSGHGHVIKQDNTCLNELEYEEYRGWRIARMNDVNHLDDG